MAAELGGLFSWVQRSPPRPPDSKETGDRGDSAGARRWRIASTGSGLQVGLAIVSTCYSTDSDAKPQLEVLSWALSEIRVAAHPVTLAYVSVICYLAYLQE